jgi:hypothetical protein
MKIKESTIFSIIKDSVENKISMEEACGRAGVPHPVLQEALNKNNSDQQRVNKEILSKIRVIAMRLAHDMDKYRQK